MSSSDKLVISDLAQEYAAKLTRKPSQHHLKPAEVSTIVMGATDRRKQLVRKNTLDLKEMALSQSPTGAEVNRSPGGRRRHSTMRPSSDRKTHDLPQQEPAPDSTRTRQRSHTLRERAATTSHTTTPLLDIKIESSSPRPRRSDRRKSTTHESSPMQTAFGSIRKALFDLESAEFNAKLAHKDSKRAIARDGGDNPVKDHHASPAHVSRRKSTHLPKEATDRIEGSPTTTNKERTSTESDDKHARRATLRKERSGDRLPEREPKQEHAARDDDRHARRGTLRREGDRAHEKDGHHHHHRTHRDEDKHARDTLHREKDKDGDRSQEKSPKEHSHRSPEQRVRSHEAKSADSPHHREHKDKGDTAHSPKNEHARREKSSSSSKDASVSSPKDERRSRDKEERTDKEAPKEEEEPHRHRRHRMSTPLVSTDVLLTPTLISPGPAPRTRRHRSVSDGAQLKKELDAILPSQDKEKEKEKEKDKHRKERKEKRDKDKDKDRKEKKEKGKERDEDKEKEKGKEKQRHRPRDDQSPGDSHRSSHRSHRHRSRHSLHNIPPLPAGEEVVLPSVLLASTPVSMMVADILRKSSSVEPLSPIAPGDDPAPMKAAPLIPTSSKEI
eukprot:TRINITY_DN676_c0_g2_i4.p1 TRINITY_DN676_c0_g2~~TRINITY_DN676_c0_g2_i4.p1  ORF type:complete len:614 (-),score=200.60 TRINITY_DN676_c0_g2_i4:489-2330(-)